MMPPAASAPRSTLSELISVLRPTGMVCLLWSLRNVGEKEVVPGVHEGEGADGDQPGRGQKTATIRKAVKRSQPSTQAAS